MAEVAARKGELARAEREIPAASRELEEWRASLADDELRGYAFSATVLGEYDAQAPTARVLVPELPLEVAPLRLRPLDPMLRPPHPLLLRARQPVRPVRRQVRLRRPPPLPEPDPAVPVLHLRQPLDVVLDGLDMRRITESVDGA